MIYYAVLGLMKGKIEENFQDIRVGSVVNGSKRELVIEKHKKSPPRVIITQNQPLKRKILRNPPTYIYFFI